MPNLPVDMDSWERLACYPQGSFYPLSDGPSTRYHRITKPYFRTCSSCLTRSQAPFCLYTLRAISGRAEAPPLLFRRRPPQSNCPPDTVPDFVTLAVRISIHQGWYPNGGSSQTSVQLSMPPTYPVRNVSKPNVRLQ